MADRDKLKRFMARMNSDKMTQEGVVAEITRNDLDDDDTAEVVIRFGPRPEKDEDDDRIPTSSDLARTARLRVPDAMAAKLSPQQRVRLTLEPLGSEHKDGEEA